MAKALTEAKSGGAKELQLRIGESFVGLNEREILKITAKTPRFTSCNIKFKSKGIPPTG